MPPTLFLASLATVVSILLCPDLVAQDADEIAYRRLTTFINFSVDLEYEVFIGVASLPSSSETIRTTYDLGYLSIAYSEELTKGRSHGVELARFGLKREVADIPVVRDSAGRFSYTLRETEINIAMRYFHSFPLVKGFGKNEDWQLSVAGAVRPFIRRFENRPAHSVTYPVNRTEFGADLQLIPGLDHDLKGPWHLQIDLPLDLARIEWDSDTTENPRVPVRQRRTTTLNADILPSRFHLRVGLGYAF